jgi:formate hydrogenlyase transcriptional activator
MSDGISTNIKERKRAEEALSRSEALFEKFFESSPDAIVTSDAEGRMVRVNAQMEKMFGYRRDELLGQHNFEEIVGDSPSLKQVLKQVETVAPTEATVLILGETGTGKELIARAIHDLSPRRHRTFVKLNCAAIPSGLLESELFGHEKGAFTGAIAQKTGRAELAHLGTLFLDEVGDIPLELQSHLCGNAVRIFLCWSTTLPRNTRGE